MVIFIVILSKIDYAAMADTIDQYFISRSVCIKHYFKSYYELIQALPIGRVFLMFPLLTIPIADCLHAEPFSAG